MSELGETTSLQGDERDAELLLYDYSKFLLTLGLLVLGGVQTLAQGPQAEKLQQAQIVIVVVALALSCVSSLSVVNDIVRARQKGRPVTRWVAMMGQSAMFFLGSGVGAFLLTWLDTLA